MALLNIEIDGKATQVPAGKTVMDAARALNIAIPHFCYHNKLSIAANCRMCLVQVEKAPKPLPACATPVTEGMKVSTHSDFAVKAQKGVMEFLLINHPLDCPICDQGGECHLQDLAVGYGGVDSRFAEEKRVVSNKDLGPLISTDMTRCIHCTRCVRYGEEIAGVMELGMGGRGEHSEIMAFMGHTVDSEVSGNAIDLCPVGALTSKPFRYSARTWELRRTPSISPHCSLGSNLVIQSKGNEVKRVLPAVNDDINECWISDKDRFAYEGLEAPDRALTPMIKQDGEWRTVSWEDALEAACAALREGSSAGKGAQELAALVSPHATFEELYLMQALMRGLGSGNIDHRLRQSDFRLDGVRQGAQWLGLPIAEVSALDRVLVVGSNLRKDHPLLAVRLRQSARKGAKVHFLHASQEDQSIQLAPSLFVRPSLLPHTLAEILVAVAEAKSMALPTSFGLSGLRPSGEAQAIASSLVGGERVAVLLGNFATQHPLFSQLYMLAEELARLTQGHFGVIGEAANSVGAQIAGAVPYAGPFGHSAITGVAARELLQTPRQVYVLLGTEPDLDSADGAAAHKAMHQAKTVIALTAFTEQVADYADIILPIAPFSETAGSYVNTEGRLQSFVAAVKPKGECRPAWKVIRVLANLLGLSGFEFEDLESLRKAMHANLAEAVKSAVFNPLKMHAEDILPPVPPGFLPGDFLERVGEVSLYRADPLVRRSPSLNVRADANLSVGVSAETLHKLGVEPGDTICVSHIDQHCDLKVFVDEAVLPGTAKVPVGFEETARLGAQSGAVTLERLG